MPSIFRTDRLGVLFTAAAILYGWTAHAGFVVPQVPEPPAVDGVLDDVWRTADSISNFVQLLPSEGMPISEPTVAYVLQTAKGIGIAFRCATLGRHPDCRPGYRDSREGDYISVYFDTFHDRRNAYRFSVNCAGVQADETLSADGRESNADWDAAFQSAVVCDSTGYSVEILIPWSSLRYARGGDIWGFNLARAIPLNGELAYSSPVTINEGLRVSGFAELTGLKPAMRSSGIELYPQGFFRTEKSFGGRSETWKPAVDLNWAITPAWRLQSTVNPDFSQVEADPFALNLSRYSLYFREKRSFFVEGQEFFRPSGGVMADMLKLFYSRRVGMRFPDGTEVPIYAGVRTTAKWHGDELAALAAATGEKHYEGFSGPSREPNAWYAAGRWNHQFARQVTGAVMAAGRFTDSLDNSVVSLDGTASTAQSQVTCQVARSALGTTSDWALKSYFTYHPRTFSLQGYATIIGDHFNVSRIGFVPWRGLRQFQLSAGPVFIRDSGLIAYGSARITAAASREFGEHRYSHSVSATLEGSFRNNWGVTADLQLGREYEPAGAYNPRAWSVYLSSDMSRRAWFSLSYYSGFAYNYARGYFGRSDYGNWFTSWNILRSFSVYLDGSSWVERDPRGRVEEVTWRFRPGTSYAVTKGMNTRLFMEIPVSKAQGVLSFRLGFSYSYNFAPKSWIYVAFNDWQRREDNSYHPQQRVLAVKIKYLISI